MAQTNNSTKGISTGISKGIITSRKKINQDGVLPLSLRGLSDRDTSHFLLTEAQTRSVSAIIDAGEDVIARIFKVTGGAPLALKLIVAQAQYMELNAVVSAIERADTDLYRFLFEKVWHQLSEGARLLLMYIGTTVVTTVSWDELLGIEIVSDEQTLLRELGQLVNYSLCETSRSADELRYGIHQLTRQFVLADLPKIWRQT